MNRGWLHYIEVTVCILILIAVYFLLLPKAYKEHLEMLSPEDFRKYIDDCSGSKYPIKVYHLSSGLNYTCGNVEEKRILFVYLYSGNVSYNPTILIVYKP